MSLSLSIAIVRHCFVDSSDDARAIFRQCFCYIGRDRSSGGWSLGRARRTSSTGGRKRIFPLFRPSLSGSGAAFPLGRIAPSPRLHHALGDDPIVQSAIGALDPAAHCSFANLRPGFHVSAKLGEAAEINIIIG